MLISKNLHKKSNDVSIKTRSTSASLSFIGQVTKHKTVKWTIERSDPSVHLAGQFKRHCLFGSRKIQLSSTGFKPGAILYQLSCEVNQLRAGQFVGLMFSPERTFSGFAEV